MMAESGVADSIEPVTAMVIGSVAQQGFEARVWPDSPATMKTIESWEPRIACAATRTITLRRARASEAGRAEASVMPLP